MTTVHQLNQYVRGKIREEVMNLRKEQLDGTSLEQWVEYFIQKYWYEPGRFLDRPLKLQPRVRRQGAYETESLSVGIPVDEVQNWERGLLEFTASRWNIINESIVYNDGCIWVELSRVDENTVKSTVARIKENIQLLNEELQQFKPHLPAYIMDQVKQRMDELKARELKFHSLVEALGGELIVTAAAAHLAAASPRVRTAITQLRRPSPTASSTVPRLATDEFETILSTIEHHLRSWERTPGTADKLGEEDHRDILLATLNGTFQLGAVGEAFSKKGKTDIWLPVPGGSVFVAELKIWSGPKTVTDATSQLLSYLTWRDSYGVVLLLSRNKDFSKVRDALPSSVAECQSIRGAVHVVDDHHWMGVHALSGDQLQTVQMHYLVYDISAG